MVRCKECNRGTKSKPKEKPIDVRNVRWGLRSLLQEAWWTLPVLRSDI